MRNRTRPFVPESQHVYKSLRPGTRQSMTTFLNEELPAAVKRKPSFEISLVLLERAFVDPAAYPGESVQEYAKRPDMAKVDVLSNTVAELNVYIHLCHILALRVFLHGRSRIGGGINKCPF